MADIRVAVLDQFEDELYAYVQAELPSGWSCSQARSYGADDQLAAARDVDVLLAGWAPITREVLDAAPRLRFIQKLGVGVDRVDLDCCRERGIGVARLAGVNAAPVAEHVVMFMLAALRRLPQADRRLRAGEWFKEEARGYQRELRGKTVGLIGLGYVGREVVQRLRGFEVSVVYYDVRRISPEDEERLGVRYEPLDDLVATSDIISLHVPLIPETQNLVDERRLARMKPSAIVINCARGGVVDETALANALREHRIAGAALDVFAEEPLGSRELLDLDNVILTSHSAGATADNFAHVARRAMANARRYLASEPIASDDLVYAPPVTATV